MWLHRCSLRAASIRVLRGLRLGLAKKMEGCPCSVKQVVSCLQRVLVRLGSQRKHSSKTRHTSERSKIGGSRPVVQGCSGSVEDVLSMYSHAPRPGPGCFLHGHNKVSVSSTQRCIAKARDEFDSCAVAIDPTGTRQAQLIAGIYTAEGLRRSAASEESHSR
jgi:hypothetical protein